MARKQSPDFDRRKEAIVAKAAALFASRGFLGTSVVDLATACKTSKALVYHYFGAKEDVLYAVMSSHLDDLLATAESIAHQTDLTPEERLSRLTHAFMEIYAGAADYQNVLLNELDNLPPERAADIVKRQRRIIEIAAGDIAVLNGGRTDDPAFPLTMLYFGMINWAHIWYRPDGAMTPDQFADMAVRVFLNGVKSR